MWMSVRDSRLSFLNKAKRSQGWKEVRWPSLPVDRSWCVMAVYLLAARAVIHGQNVFMAINFECSHSLKTSIVMPDR